MTYDWSLMLGSCGGWVLNSLSFKDVNEPVAAIMKLYHHECTVTAGIGMFFRAEYARKMTQ